MLMLAARKGGGDGENCRFLQLLLAILSDTSFRNAAGERLLPNQHKHSTTALVSCSPSHGNVQHRAPCDVLVCGHRSAR